MIPQLLQLAATAVPLLTIMFVLGLTLHKGYTKIRSRYNARVNCWFCNADARVPYAERNSWTCPHCDQYNGFTKDGDYNRDMVSQRDCSKISQKSSSSSNSTFCANSYYGEVQGPGTGMTAAISSNGLCDHCNEAQRLKVEKLAQFEPKSESRYDQELKVFRNQLEQQFRLCRSCERHVNGVLLDKKKMVLGSKFLNFLVKRAELLKQPYINRLDSAQRQQKLERYRQVMTILTGVNIVCLISRLPLITSEQFTNILGQSFGSFLFYAYSHFLTLVRVLGSYAVGTDAECRDLLAKLLLYFNFLRQLALYTVGLSYQQAQQATFVSLFIGAYPYAMLALSFLHKIKDSLKLTRFTLILLMWSAYVKGSSALSPHIDEITLILLGSVITIGLLVTNRSNLLKQKASQDESGGDSFHRLCGDEFISDEETLSMLSQQLTDCSNLSARSPTVCPSLAPSISMKTARSQVGVPASSVLSLDSLHLSTNHRMDEQQQQQAWRSNYGSPAPAPTVISAAPSPHAHSQQHQAMMFQQQRQHQQQQQQQLQHQQQQQQMMMRQWNWTSSNLASGQRAFATSTQSLLMPSRLPSGIMGGGKGNGLGGNVSAWLAANQSMNQDLRTASLMRLEDKQQTQPQLSRTSSQSSGFESHPRPEPYEGPGGGLPLPSPFLPAGSDYQFAGQQHQQQQPHLPQPQQSQHHQQTIQPGDLLRKWINDTARAPHPIH